MHILCELWITKYTIAVTIGRIGAFFIPKRNWFKIGFSPGSHLAIGPLFLGAVIKRASPLEPFSWH